MALPVNGSTHLIPAYYSFYRPRKDERLSWPSWLTCSGWLTHIRGHPSAAGRAQDREISPARDRRSTTEPRHQLYERRGAQMSGRAFPDVLAHVYVRRSSSKAVEQKTRSRHHCLRTRARQPASARRCYPAMVVAFIMLAASCLGRRTEGKIQARGVMHSSAERRAVGRTYCAKATVA